MNVASRLPTLFVIGLVVVATTLLVAGYGVPVGIGVVAGALLGGTWIAAILAMRPRTSGGSTYWFGGTTTGVLQRPSSQELVERHHHDWMRVATVDASELRRVIAVGTEIEAGGARVELVAVEIRQDGGVAVLVAHTRPPTGQAGHFVDVAVSDDEDTGYVSAGQGNAGGNPGTSRYDVRFAPAPPPDACVLTIRIAAFDSPFPVPAERLEGPWEFLVSL
jgi:hypothetical protein